ncbi:MAG: hypothetical protein REH83_03800 [Rickettsiella sp.]|nr:hypothetical protein [Rickettsiella sp.]
MLENMGPTLSRIDLSEEVSNVWFASPLQDQDPSYDISSSVYQIPVSQRESVDSLPNTRGLDTIKKTRDMGSQTDLMFPSSSISSSSVSEPTTPPHHRHL